jgi:hypothetical protein
MHIAHIAALQPGFAGIPLEVLRTIKVHLNCPPAIKAASSMHLPRPTLMRTALLFMVAIAAALMIW